MDKRIIRLLICIPILVVLFFSWMIIQMGLSYTSNKAPIVFDPKGICGGTNGIYAIDTGSQKVCAYDWNGELMYAIKYASSGDCILFSDGDGNLCRYSVREDTVYVYDQSGKIVNKYSVSPLQEQQILELRIYKDQVTSGDKSAEFKSCIFGDKITITSAEKQIVVQSGNALWNIVKPLLILAIACVVVIVFVSAIQTALFFAMKKKHNTDSYH